LLFDTEVVFRCDTSVDFTQLQYTTIDFNLEARGPIKTKTFQTLSIMVSSSSDGRTSSGP
jgi:hypothetical protein